MSDEPVPQDDREPDPVDAYRAAWRQASRNLRLRLAPLIALAEEFGSRQSEDSWEHELLSAIRDLWVGDPNDPSGAPTQQQVADHLGYSDLRSFEKRLARLNKRAPTTDPNEPGVWKRLTRRRP